MANCGSVPGLDAPRQSPDSAWAKRPMEHTLAEDDGGAIS
jgi:hypothetical protein